MTNLSRKSSQTRSRAVRKTTHRGGVGSQKKPKDGKKKKGLFSCCISKKKGKRASFPKPTRPKLVSSKTRATPTRTILKKRSARKRTIKPIEKKSTSNDEKSKTDESKSTKSPVKRSLEIVKEEKKDLPRPGLTKEIIEEAEKELVTKKEKKGSKEKLDGDQKQTEKEQMTTAIDLDEENQQLRSKQSDEKLLPHREDASPEQSLEVKKFTCGGRNIFRWEYKESVPIGYSSPTRISKLLEQKPKKIESAEEKKRSESKKVSKSAERIEEISSQTKISKASKAESKKKCCSCCDCEGNKKLLRG